MTKFIKNSIFTFILLLSTFLAYSQVTNMNVTVSTSNATATIKWSLVPTATLYNVAITDLISSKVVFSQNYNNPTAIATVKLAGGSYKVKVTPYKNLVPILNVTFSERTFSIIIDEVVFKTTPTDDCPACGLTQYPLTSDPIRLSSYSGKTTNHNLVLSNGSTTTIKLKIAIAKFCSYRNTCTINSCSSSYPPQGNSISINGFTITISSVDFTDPSKALLYISGPNGTKYSLVSTSTPTDCSFPTAPQDSKVQAYSPDVLYLEKNIEEVASEPSEVVKNTVVSPNPFTETLNINYANNVIDNNLNLYIFNIQGQLIKSAQENNLSLGENNITFDMQDTPKGLYFLKVTDTQNTQKIFKLTKM